ncbi:hypothetical protein [Aquisphaera insulae]|uniref:hypothetical protein n=1 Tax=Aquisphaera insulae TaxID=2712864 RepID=UPI0013EB3EF5|nr:hypothetical protein [Aquisphaera insulae]
MNDATRRVAGSAAIRAAAGLCLAALIAALPGCSTGEAHAVDTSKAREALASSLDAWKRGEDSRSVSSITIQDFDWERGAKLEGYEILGDGQAKGANLSIQVKLRLAAAAGKKATEKSVYYLVGTSPSVTVFRDTLRR